MSYPKSFSDLPFPSKTAYAAALKKHSESKRAYEECCNKTALRELQRSSWCGQIPNELHKQWATERATSKQDEASLASIIRQDQIDLNNHKKKLDEEMAVAWKADEPRRISEMEKLKRESEQRSRELEQKKAREAEQKVREAEQKKAREEEQKKAIKEKLKSVFKHYGMLLGQEIHTVNMILYIADKRVKENRCCHKGIVYERNYLNQNRSILLAEMPKYIEHLNKRVHNHKIEIEREAKERLLKEKREAEVKQAMNRLRLNERTRNSVPRADCGDPEPASAGAF